MNDEVYNLHLRAGELSGVERTCGKKNSFLTEEAAQKAANAHNRWDKRKHDVEPYPCFFCKTWHIGNIMPIERLRSICNTSL